MKAVILDGSAAADDARTARAARALEAVFAAEGAEVTRFTLRELDLHACTGCFGCWTRRPGECVIDDAARDIVAAVVASDVYAVATPLVFGTYGSQVKRVLDRSICLVLPFFTVLDGEIHHEKRYERYPREIVLGVQAEHDAEDAATFLRLTDRNAINMHNPGHGAEVLAGDFSEDEALAAARRLLALPEVAA